MTQGLLPAGGGGAPLPAVPSTAAAPVLDNINSLWLLPDGSKDELSPAASPLRHPLKSLTAAAAAAVACSAPAPIDDDAHLIAPISRAASFQEQEAGAWRTAKQLGEAPDPTDAAGSPRISALLRRLSQQLLPAALGNGSIFEVGPAAVTHAAAADYLELAVESSGGSEVQGIFSHASPAHLLAPAQPAACLWEETSPPPVELQLEAVPATNPRASQQVHLEQPQLQLLRQLLQPELDAAGPGQGLQEQLPAIPLAPQLSELSSPSSGDYSPAVGADGNGQQSTWQQDQQPQQPPQLPREAGVRRSLAEDFVFCLPHDLHQAPSPPQPQQPQQRRERSVAGLQALAAAQRRSGWEGSPVSVATSCNLRRHGSAVEPAVQDASSSGGDAADRQRAWSVDPHGHIDLDLDLLADCLPQAPPSAAAPAVPAAAVASVDAAAADEVLFGSPSCNSPSSGGPVVVASGPGSPLSLALSAVPDAPLAVADWGAPLSEQQQQEHVVGAAVAGQYAAVAQQFEQLDLRRIRRAVRASCKRQAAAAADTRPTMSLLQRLAGGCSIGAARSRPLRRGLERQRLHLLCLGRLPYSPDEPLHFQLFSAVCSGFTGMNAIEDHPCELGGSPPAWRVLGFSAANPARELGDAGVLPLLMLLMLLERAPRLAARLLASSLGIPMQSNAVAEVDGQQQIELQQQQEARLPPFSLAEVAVEVTGWTLRVLGSGALNSEAQRLGSASGAAEAFWLGGVDGFLAFYEAVAAVSASTGGIDQRWLEARRLLLAVLMQAQGRTCADVRATAMCGQQLG